MAQKKGDQKEAKENQKTSIKKRITRFIILIWLSFFGGILTLSLLLHLISIDKFGKLPTFEELENPKNYLASEVYTSDGYLLGKYYKHNRSPIRYEQMSPHLINALIATEDARYREHSGIDVNRLITATMFAGTRGGGSTITQQLAKNLFHKKRMPVHKRVLQKLKEWVIAMRLEKSYTKNEIIAMYFNTVEFTGNAFGIKSAAKEFFDKHPSQLRLEEAAVLVGMLKATSTYNPARNPEKSRIRRNVVLNQMNRFGDLPSVICDSLKEMPLEINHHVISHNTGLAPYFREKLRKYLKHWASKNYKANGDPYNIYRDGLKIVTTLDSRMQRYAEASVKEHMSELQEKFFDHWRGYTNAPFDKELENAQIDKIIWSGVRKSERYRRLKYDLRASNDSIVKNFNTPVKTKLFSWKGTIDTVIAPIDSVRYAKHLLHAGFLSMEPGTGHIKAWVGGIDHYHFKYDHVKHGKRQVGSTFKPFVYTVALDNGVSPCKQVPDQPYRFKNDDGSEWTPKNSGGRYSAELLSLKYGLADSRNSIAAWVMKEFGPEPVVEIAKRMGITSDIKPYPSICLGPFDISLYEMVGAYGTFPNKGIWVEPIFLIRIEDKNGNILQDFTPQKREAISEQTAFGMVQMMRGTVDGVRHQNEKINPALPKWGAGTAMRLRSRYHPYQFKGQICGKTGTTQNQSDGWFLGYTPQLVNGVWTGAEDRSVHFRTIHMGQAASMALPIWGKYMKKIYADSTLNYSEDVKFEAPRERVTINLNCDDSILKGEDAKKSGLTNDTDLDDEI